MERRRLFWLALLPLAPLVGCGGGGGGGGDVDARLEAEMGPDDNDPSKPGQEDEPEDRSSDP